MILKSPDRGLPLLAQSALPLGGVRALDADGDVVVVAAGGDIESTLVEALEPLWLLNERNWLAEDDPAAAFALLERQTL